MSLKLVPFNSAWTNHDKIDIHAIYRRPRFVEDEFGERSREYKNGVATWDMTGPLPIRQHSRWLAKGFEYVTLANRESLMVAYKAGTLPEGATVSTYDQHQTGGPWNWKKYCAGQEADMTAEAEQIASDVRLFGSEAVTKIMRRSDPNFELPPSLQGIPRPVEELARDHAELLSGDAARPQQARPRPHNKKRPRPQARPQQAPPQAEPEAQS